MTSNEIRAQLLYRGISQADIAREQGVTRAAINHVIRGKSRTRAHRALIASKLHMPYKTVWGEEDPGEGRCHSSVGGN